MTVMPAGGDSADYGKCERVSDLIQKIMETEPPSIAWMTGELGNRINAAQYGAFTMLQMSLITEGMEPDEAKKSAGQQAALLMFELGMRAGEEIAKADAFREMFGGDFPTLD